jgi:hypothetical protein
MNDKEPSGQGKSCASRFFLNIGTLTQDYRIFNHDF